MLSHSDLKNIIISNLADDKIVGVQYYLTELLERRKHGDGIPQYRIKNTLTDTYVQTLVDIGSSIDAASMSVFCHPMESKLSTNQMVMPVIVYVNNLTVELIRISDSDVYFGSASGTGIKKLAFTVGYTGDGDADLPLKIINVKLVDKDYSPMLAR